MFLQPFIKDGEINIGREDWKRLNEEHTDEEIRRSIIEHIKSGDIDFPWSHYTDEYVDKIIGDFGHYHCKGVQLGDINTPVDYKYELGNKYFTESVKWNHVSNAFQEHNRMQCGYTLRQGMSPIDMFFDERVFYGYLRALWTLKMDRLGSPQLHTTIGMRDYIASQFRPAIAKAIYEYFDAHDVLDFSAGWGDRLAGFYAADCTRSYIGIDPNERVYKDYFRQAERYGQVLGEKQCTFINSPAETVKIDEEIVDFIFTSPPYFNTEVYNIDESQSCNRYKTGNAWLEGFMYPTLDMCDRALKKGGIIAINIADVRYKKQRVYICDTMNDYLAAKGYEYVDGMGMKLNRRPNTDRSDLAGVFVEPIWVWRKPAE